MGACFGKDDGVDKAEFEELRALVTARHESTVSERDFHRVHLMQLSHDMGNVLMNAELAHLRSQLSMWTKSERQGKQEQAAFIKKEMTMKYQIRAALLVSDMSGLSSMTKEKGANASFCLIKKMQAICLPILRHCGGDLIKVSADDLFCIFPDAETAVRAGNMMLSATSHNAAIQLNIGVDYGTMWAIPNVDVFGGAADTAFIIGEDLAENEVMVTTELAKKLAAANGARFTYTNERTLDVNGTDTTVVAIQDTSVLTQAAYGHHVRHNDAGVINANVNAIEPPRFVALLREYDRAGSDAERKMVDAHIDDSYMMYRATLVINMPEWAPYAQENGALAYMAQVMALKNLIELEATSRGGVRMLDRKNRMVPHEFVLFNDANHALTAAVDMMIKAKNPEFGLDLKLSIGISWGNIQVLRESNAFGDAVNMAFKLGEDTGGEDDLFITSETYDQIKDLRKFDEIEMEEKEVMKSKVLIPYKAVKWQQLDVATWDRTQDDLAVGSGRTLARRDKLTLERPLHGFQGQASIDVPNPIHNATERV